MQQLVTLPRNVKADADANRQRIRAELKSIFNVMTKQLIIEPLEVVRTKLEDKVEVRTFHRN